MSQDSEIYEKVLRNFIGSQEQNRLFQRHKIHVQCVLFSGNKDEHI